MNRGLAVRLRKNFGSRAGYTHSVPDDENPVLEFHRAVWGKSLDRTDRPLRCKETKAAAVRFLPSSISSART